MGDPRGRIVESLKNAWSQEMSTEPGRLNLAGTGFIALIIALQLLFGTVQLVASSILIYAGREPGPVAPAHPAGLILMLIGFLIGCMALLVILEESRR